MPADQGQPDKLDFFGLLPNELDRAVAAWGWPRFRADQLRDWVYRKLVADPQQMSNLSKLDRVRLSEHFALAEGKVVRHQSSADDTQKLLLEWPDGANAETVMIPDGPRRTACISSQVGCPVQCRFCASGVNGVKGNLTAGQIVEQVWEVNNALARKREPSDSVAGHPRTPARAEPDDRITNIVLMGMGEPLANYANVMKAIRILHDPKCFNIGARKITISTVGVPPKMRDLANEDLPLNLAISLHAPTESLRRALIPWAEHFALHDILDAARYYFDKTGREITLEYILLAGVNDRPEHARQLAELCGTLRAN